MYCHNCGKEYKSGRHCVFCGALLADFSSEIPAEASLNKPEIGQTGTGGDLLSAGIIFKKKNNKKLLIVLASVAVLLYIVAVLLFGSEKLKASSGIKTSHEYVAARTDGGALPAAEQSSATPAVTPQIAKHIEPVSAFEAMNAKNGGIAAYAWNTVYCIAQQGEILAEDVVEVKPVFDGIRAKCIYIEGNWLYYTDFDTGSVCRTGIDGNERQVVDSRRNCSYINVYGSKVYFIAQSEDNGKAIWSILCSDTESGIAELLLSSEREMSRLCCYDGYLYYIASDFINEGAAVHGDLPDAAPSELYRLKISGKNEPDMLYEYARDYAFFKDKLLICARDGVYTTTATGKSAKRVSTMRAVDAYVLSDKLICINEQDKHYVYYLDLQGNENDSVPLIEYGSKSINVCADIVYYKSIVASVRDKLYSFSMDFGA